MKFEQARLDRICDWMQSYVDDRKYAGSSFLMMHQGREVLFHSCGLRSVENNLPFERDTLVRIYSMTKPITTAALMILVERGEVHLGAQVSEYISDFTATQALVPGATRLDQTEPAPAPTLHQLLTHTSGLSYPFNPGILASAMDELDLVFGPKEGSLAERVSLLSTLPFAFQPGTRWEYSVGIDVIGRVIEVISGQSLEQFLAKEIFKPLGMSQTGFRVPAGAGDRFASLYTPLAGNAMALNEARTGEQTLRLVDNAEASPFESATMCSGGGGLVSTIDDFARFSEMLRNRGRFGDQQILAPKTVEFMLHNHLPGDIASMGPQSFAEQPMEGMGFGLGGAVVINPGRTCVPGSMGDFSWGGMASTFFWVDRQNDFTAIFFTQLSPSSSYPSRAELKALTLGSIIE